FDVDGQTSTAVLVQTLREIGAKVQYTIPVRARASHGVQVEGLKHMIDAGVQVLITCDTGITAFDAADYAREHGIEYYITDHHKLPDNLPNANAITNPQFLSADHPLRHLCGVGVAYQLCAELLNRFGKPEVKNELLDLVAMGTVADMAILKSDNRCLVQRGLEVLRNTSRIGLKAIFEQAELNQSNISDGHIGFVLAPRLNAAGRLDDSNPMVELLLTADTTRAKVISAQLEGLNARRKLLMDQVFQAVRAQIEKNPTILKDPVLVLSHPEWPAGVIGIVASRIVDLYHRPVILLNAPPGMPVRGSARSIDGLDITSAIASQQELLDNFGGHPMAAGLSLKAENLADFQKGINRYVSEWASNNPITNLLEVDAYIQLDQIDLGLVEQIDRLAPFGPGNENLTLAANNVVILSSSTIGKGGEHLQLVIEDEQGHSQRVMYWQGAGAPLPPGRFDLAFHVRASDFRGSRDVQVEWVDARLIEEQEFEISTQKSNCEIIDHRSAGNSEELLKQYAQAENTQIWQEGEAENKVGQDRYHLKPAENLVLCLPPAGMSELLAIVKAVKPKRVVLFSYGKSIDDGKQLLGRLAGLLKFAVQKRSGFITFQELASACNQKEDTVRAALTWLEAGGFFAFHFREDGSCLVSTPGSIDPERIKTSETLLSALLNETMAFRSYYQRMTEDALQLALQSCSPKK
ncbi:MAG: single-stranded-DNA-specific exonuclease RecJ, partial [Anaerolineaceae bacterium]|nr:single-stranded-DNA-specific exonuclease RecJ [Anaerolineaceae bacterium]